jgi:hypothetical protein
MVGRREESDFQILARFAQPPAVGNLAHVGGPAAELAAESVGEMAVARKAELKRERGQIVRPASQPFERSAKAKPGQIAMDRHPGSLLKYAGEMKGRSVHRTGDAIERDPLRYDSTDGPAMWEFCRYSK